jgi:hypothetical protein
MRLRCFCLLGNMGEQNSTHAHRWAKVESIATQVPAQGKLW